MVLTRHNSRNPEIRDSFFPETRYDLKKKQHQQQKTPPTGIITKTNQPLYLINRKRYFVSKRLFYVKHNSVETETTYKELPSMRKPGPCLFRTHAGLQQQQQPPKPFATKQCSGSCSQPS